MFNLGIAQLCVNISDLFVFTDDAVYDPPGKLCTQCVKMEVYLWGLMGSGDSGKKYTAMATTCILPLPWREPTAKACFFEQIHGPLLYLFTFALVSLDAGVWLSNHIVGKWWDEITNPIYNNWSLEIYKLSYPTLYNGCNFLSMLGSKLIRVGKGAKLGCEIRQR